MSFGSKRLDDAFDKWATQTPEEAGYYDEDDEGFIDNLKDEDEEEDE